MSLILPNEILLYIASHLTVPPRIHHRKPTPSTSSLSTLSRSSSTLHSLLSPLLYSHLDLSQSQLVQLLNCPSANFSQVKHLTLHSLWSDFNIDHTKSIAFLESTSSERVVFSNATTLTLRDTLNSTMAFDPIPMLASLPKLLRVERLILDLRMLSWRLNGLPPLWPKSLKVVEMYCKNWTLPFIVPGIHHIIHLDDTSSPFLRDPRPATSITEEEDFEYDPDPDDDSYRPHRPLLTAAFRWIALRIESCALLEETQGTATGEMTTWEVRVCRGGKKEVRWAERRVGEMLLEAGVGRERVEVGDDGDVLVKCFRIVVA